MRFDNIIHISRFVVRTLKLEHRDATTGPRLFNWAHLVKRGTLALAVCTALLITAAVTVVRWRRAAPAGAPVSAPPTALSRIGSETAPAPRASIPSPADELDQRLLELTNARRTVAGLQPLVHDAVLSAAARAHSEDMLRRRFFAHVNPDRETPQDRVKRDADQPAISVGENLWMWSGEIVPPGEVLGRQAMAEWMASPAHRDNLLRAGYTRLGIGAAIDAGQVRVTEIFSEPALHR